MYSRSGSRYKIDLFPVDTPFLSFPSSPLLDTSACLLCDSARASIRSVCSANACASVLSTRHDSVSGRAHRGADHLARATSEHHHLVSIAPVHRRPIPASLSLSQLNASAGNTYHCIHPVPLPRPLKASCSLPLPVPPYSPNAGAADQDEAQSTAATACLFIRPHRGGSHPSLHQGPARVPLPCSTRGS